MQCNIDARGRAARRNGGIVCSILGLAAAAVALSGYRRAAFLTGGILLILAGLFQLFEARKGWCAVRALGFKTPI